MYAEVVIDHDHSPIVMSAEIVVDHDHSPTLMSAEIVIYHDHVESFQLKNTLMWLLIIVFRIFPQHFGLCRKTRCFKYMLNSSRRRFCAAGPVQNVKSITKIITS